MKILIINDLLIHGGAEMQSIREKKILQKEGHDAYLLTFDNNFPENHNEYNEYKGFFNIKLKNKAVNKIFNKLFLNSKLLKKIESIIDSISPDVIHVNNLYQAPITQYKSLSKYKVIQTIRDYSAVCPRDTCIDINNDICEGERYNNCYKKCGNSLSNISKIARAKLANKSRRKYIYNYLCPSEKLTEYCKKNDYAIKCINNPFDFEKFSNINKNVDFKNKIFMYYGVINRNKGVLNLINAFTEFEKNKNIKLMIAGKLDSKIEKEFELAIDNNKKITYLGNLNYDNMIEVLETVHTIIVPSVWMENYPNTVLEGLATKTFVVGSNRGGIPEMLANGRGYIFDVTQKEDIIRVLEKSYNLTEQEYEKIVNDNRQYVESNNSFSTFYSRLIQEFDRIVK